MRRYRLSGPLSLTFILAGYAVACFVGMPIKEALIFVLYSAALLTLLFGALWLMAQW